MHVQFCTDSFHQRWKPFPYYWHTAGASFSLKIRVKSWRVIYTQSWSSKWLQLLFPRRSQLNQLSHFSHGDSGSGALKSFEMERGTSWNIRGSTGPNITLCPPDSQLALSLSQYETGCFVVVCASFWSFLCQLVSWYIYGFNACQFVLFVGVDLIEAWFDQIVRAMKYCPPCIWYIPVLFIKNHLAHQCTGAIKNVRLHRGLDAAKTLQHFTSIESCQNRVQSLQNMHSPSIIFQKNRKGFRPSSHPKV